MAMIWVQAGACGHETTIEAKRISMTEVAVEMTTTCEHIQELAEVLQTLDLAHEMSVGPAASTTYRLASDRVCRSSCVVPAAILKAMEVEANIFPAAEVRMVFV